VEGGERGPRSASSPARRRALRRGRRAPEAQPLEQGPPRLAPGVHSHQPPPAAAAWTRKDVDGEHPAQQRRPPRRTLPRRRRRPRARAWPRGRRPVLLSLGAPRHHRRSSRRVPCEHAVKAQRAKTRRQNQQRQLLDQLQRVQQQVRSAVGPRMRQRDERLSAATSENGPATTSPAFRRSQPAAPSTPRRAGSRASRVCSPRCGR
jgi:hypothetical protein